MRVCTAYRAGARTLDEFPSDLRTLESAEPVYEELDGWRESLGGIRSFAKLPAAARKYVRRIEEIMSAPVEILSVGPGRDETLWIGRGKR